MDNTCNCNNCEIKDLFFASLDSSQMETMCSQKIENEFKKGDIITKAGDKIEDFVYLKSGLVKLFNYNDKGKEQIITFAKPFDFVSLISIFSNKTYEYSVVALEPTVTCNITLTEITNLIMNNGTFSINLIEKMSNTSNKIINEFLDIKKRNLMGRVAYMLLFFSEQVYIENEFELPVSRKEIAEYIGMSTENVIRALSQLRKDKIIKIFGKFIEIVDNDKLSQISRLG